jgi:hypothetical protein
MGGSAAVCLSNIERFQPCTAVKSSFAAPT